MYRLKIEHDQDAQNPRTDCDHADVMYCEHRRYDLGDKDAEHPYNEVAYVMLQHPGTILAYVLDDSDTADGTNLILDDVLAMCEEHAEEAADEAEAFDDDGEHGGDHHDDECDVCRALADAARAELAVRYLSAAKWETERRLRPGIAIIRPLSLYDHSGITISAGAPSCPWDSGYVGCQYITDEALQSEWNGDRERALAYMDATLQTYDDYLRGNVHGFTLELGTLGTTAFADGTTEQTIRWDHEDSCWGFIGDWHGKDDPTGMREHLPREARELFDSMDWSDEGEWRYSEDVPEELRE